MLDPGVVRRRWRWPALGLFVGLLGGLAATFVVHDTLDANHYYRATHTLVVKTTGVEAGGTGPVRTLDLAQAAYLVHSTGVTQAVSASLKLPTEGVDQRVSAVARPDLRALEVTAIGLAPEEAVLVADATAEALAKVVESIEAEKYAMQTAQAQQRLDRIEAQLDEVRGRLAANPSDLLLSAEISSLVDQRGLAYEEYQALTAPGGPSGALTTIQPAAAIEINGPAFVTRLRANEAAASASVVRSGSTTTTQPSNANETNLNVAPPASKPTRVFLGGVVGLLMGTSLGLILEIWDDRIRQRPVVEAVTGLSVLVEVPKRVRDQLSRGRVVAVDLPDSLSAERYRSLRTTVMFALHDHLDPTADGMWVGGEAPVVMMTSPHPSEGKTTTIANLSAVFGASGMRTLVIDGDYRRPSIASYVVPDDEPEADAPRSTRLHGVSFLYAPEGASPAEIVKRLGEAVAQHRRSFDIILLDTPPMLTTNDAAELSPLADGVLLVLRSGRTRRISAERAATILRRIGAPVIGVVLNGCEGVAPYQYGAYLREDSRGRSARSSGRRFGEAPARQPEEKLLSNRTSRRNG